MLAGTTSLVTDFHRELLLRFLTVSLTALLWGIVMSDWDGALVFALILTVFVAMGTLLGWHSPNYALEGDWDDLRWRQRMRANRALLTGSEPTDPRTARVVRLARRPTVVKPTRPLWDALGSVVAAAVCIGLVVLAIVRDAPPGWIAAGTASVLGLFALRFHR